jgi:hypothetical protein
LHGFALYTLKYSNLNNTALFLLSILALVNLSTYLYQHLYGSKQLIKISLNQQNWSLFLANGKQLEYQDSRIIVLNGLFLLLMFEGFNDYKRVLLFTDQMSKKERHKLLLGVKLANHA